MRFISGQLRITIGMLILLVSLPAVAGDVVLPFYNADGFTSAVVYSNRTASDIALPSDSRVSPSVAEIVKAQAAIRKTVTLPSFGVLSVPAPAGLTVYAELTSPFGAVIRIKPLQAVASANLYELLTSDGYNSAIFIGALSPTVARIVNGTEASIPAGGAVILPASAETVAVENKLAFGTQGAAPIYVFAYVNHHSTGSLFAIQPE
jgi:hypothetical protein